MKGFVIPLLGVTLVLLLTYSIESVTADHLEPGRGIFNSENQVNLILDKDSKYRIHLIVEVRNAQGQLISVTEKTGGNVIPHKITDHVFDDLMGEKEIVTIDDIKYEKVQYSGKPDMKKLVEIYNRPSHYIGHWVVTLCSTIDNHGYTCIDPFSTSTAFVSLVEDNVVQNHWTILRILN
tara:strand:+ start:117 stop:653 length:537 start_codon:yes stop_codon:yes gene_type:complete